MFKDYPVFASLPAKDLRASGRAAWFTDSEGNILNLVELPPGMTM